MLEKIKKASFFIVFLSMFFASTNFALAEFEKPTNRFGATDVQYGKSENASLNSLFGRIITWLLGIVGALSVLIIIIGGIFYIISGGDSGKTDAAKGWILYAVVGLIVALLGWVIVNTVIGGLEGDLDGTGGAPQTDTPTNSNIPNTA